MLLKRKREDAPQAPINPLPEPNTTTKRTKRSDEKLIKHANSMSIQDFSTKSIDSTQLTYSPRTSNTQFEIDVKSSSQLSEHELESCFRLIEATSRKDYEASTSFGWRPKRKRREMREVEMRYLLVRSIKPPPKTSDEPSDDPPSNKPPENNNNNVNNNINNSSNTTPIQAFLSLLLTHDSSPAVPVLYIYEIHLSEGLQGQGLGAHLMGIAEGVASAVGVRKTMLTCFVTNSKALRFYRGLGYGIDECSPGDRVTRAGVVRRSDYLILSKVC